MATEETEDRGDFLPDETEEAPEEKTEEEEGTEEAESGELELEPEAEEAEEAEEPEEAEEAEEEHMLPKSRYDSVQKRNRALQEKIVRMEDEREQQLAAHRAAPAEETTESGGELAALDDKINDALLDGDRDLASKYRAEQRDIERSIFTAELEASTQSATIQAREQTRLDASIDFLEATYDELDPSTESFDQATVDEMETLRNAFVASGEYSPSQALIKAAKYIFPDVPSVEEIAQPPSKKAAIKKAVKANQKQPPDINGVGADADSAGIKDGIDPGALSEKDFDALPEATLARLRGDMV